MNSRIFIWLNLLASCLLLSMQVSAAQLSPYRATYSVEKYQSEIARTTYHLKVADDHLHFTQHTELTGFVSLFRDDTVSESSDIDLAADHWRLQHYKYSQTGDSRPRDMQFSIDWPDTAADNRDTRIIGRYIDQDFELETGGETWDPLSVLLAIARDYRAGNKQFSYDVVTKGSIKKYNFILVGNDVIETEDENYDAILFTRTSGRRTTNLWLSDDEHLIPVRMEQLKDGELNTSMSLYSLDTRDD